MSEASTAGYDDVRNPLLIDLFSCAGGAARGYVDAGFDVIGVDNVGQKHYPYEFWQMDWREGLDRALDLGIDAIHASPPCQSYSVTRSLHDSEYPELIEPVREALQATGLPYVIENVEGARWALRNPVRLCGSSFGLGVRRHRLFETSFPVLSAPACLHHLQPEPIDVTGTGGPAARKPGGGGGIHRKPRNLAQAQEVMGIDWMTRRELGQAVPPAYTRWLGALLMDEVRNQSSEAVA